MTQPILAYRGDTFWFVDPCLRGMVDRFEKSQSSSREWMSCPDLRLFLAEARAHLGEADAVGPGASEKILHFLMGLIDGPQLPEPLRPYAGSWRDKNMARQLSDLIRTNRHFHSEPDRKSREKISYLCKLVLWELDGAQADAIFSTQDPRDLAVLLSPSSLSGSKVRPFLEHYLREEKSACYDDERVAAALYQSLASEKFQFVGEVLSDHFQQCPEAFHPDSRAGKLMRIWLTAARSTGSENHCAHDLRPWLPRFFPVDPDAPCHLQAFRELFLEVAGSWPTHFAKGMEKAILTEPRYQEVKDVALCSMPHWQYDVDGALSAWLVHWPSVAGADKVQILSSMASLVANGKVTDVDHLKVVANAFRSGRLTFEDEAGHSTGFFVKLFEAVDCPYQDFLLKHIAYFADADKGDPQCLAELIYQARPVVPPLHAELGEAVYRPFHQEMQAMRRDAGQQELPGADIARMANALENRLHEGAVKDRFAQDMDSVLQQHGIALPEVHRQAVVRAACGVFDQRVRSVRQALSMALPEQSPEECRKLAERLTAKSHSDMIKEWFLDEFALNVVELELAFPVFWRYLDWNTRVEHLLQEEIEGIGADLGEQDASVHKACTPREFAHHVLATLPYRSLSNLAAILKMDGVDEKLRNLLTGIQADFQAYLEDSQATGLLFIGYSGAQGKKRPSFLKVTDLSLLNPLNISPSSMPSFEICSDPGHSRSVAREDLQHMALPNYLWKAMLAQFTHSKRVVQKLTDLMMSFVQTSGQTLDEHGRGVLKGALASATSSNAGFAASLESKKALKSAWADDEFQRAMSGLIEHIGADRHDLAARIVARKAHIPFADAVDRMARELADEAGAEPHVVYYLLGVLLARLSSSGGLGWHAGTENEAVPGPRLLSAYCLAKCQEFMPADRAHARTRQTVGQVTEELLLHGTCSNMLAGRLFGAYIGEEVHELAGKAEELLQRKGRYAEFSARSSLPDFGLARQPMPLEDGVKKAKGWQLPPRESEDSMRRTVALKLMAEPGLRHVSEDRWLRLLRPRADWRAVRV